MTYVATTLSMFMVKSHVHFDTGKSNNEEDWGILLIDARSNFNEGDLKIMVYIARHE